MFLQITSKTLYSLTMINNLKIDVGLILGFVSILFWSTAATAFKIALVNLEVFEVLLISICTSIVIFLAYDLFELLKSKVNSKNETTPNLLKTKSLPKTSTVKSNIIKKNIQKYFTYLLNPFLYYIVLFEAYSLLTAQLALTLNYLWPIILIIMMIISKREIFENRLIFSIILSFLGFLVIISKGDINNIKIIYQSLTDFQTADNSSSSYLFSKGVFLAIFSSFIWAFYWLIKSSKTNKSNDNLSINFIISFLAIIVYLLITDIELLANFGAKINQILTDKTIKFNENSFWASVYIGCFEMGITFILWLKALNSTQKPIILANMVYISPFLSIFWISLLLNESIYITSIIGLIMIIISIFFYNKKTYRTKNTKLTKVEIKI